MVKKKYHKDAFDRIDDERKNKILEVGIDEFSLKGYDGANINIIAKNAGISIGLMYKYFATKEDLFITCLKHGMDILVKALYDIMVSDDKILIKAENLIKTICVHSKQNTKYIKMYNEISNVKNSAEMVREIVEEIESRRSSIYIISIEKALEKGDLRNDMNPKFFALFLDNLLTSLQFAYTCDYYKEKFRIYTGIDVNECDDEQIISELLKFIESAFSFGK